MKNLKVRAAALAAGIILVGGVGLAQRGGGDWQTAGFDAQRSSWLRGDGKISVESMSKPGYKMIWKIKTPNAARHGSALTPPALLDFFIGHRGFRTLAFVGASGNSAMGIDTDLGKMEWTATFAKTEGLDGTTAACPGGMTSAVTRPVSLGYPGAAQGRGFGRGAMPKSAVGEPLEGAAGLKELAARRPQQGFGPPGGPPQAAGAKPQRTAPPPNPFQRQTQWVHALTSDGKFHSVYVSNGDEPIGPIDFLPAGARATGLLVSNRIAYVATVNNCGGVPDGIWSLDIEAKKVTSWKAPGTIAGANGFSVSPEGLIYVAAGKQLTILDPKTLAVKGSVTAGADFNSSPLLFDQKDHDMVAITTTGGQLHIFDGENLGSKPVASLATAAGGYAVGAIASWMDSTSARWILVPTANSVETVQFADGALKAAWKSHALAGAATPIVVNGVVFALSTGGKTGKAVLYALDGMNGKELWNSGAAITSNVTTGGMSSGGGRVYVSGVDGTQYAFGFHLEI